jgi:hypothetical protein
MRTLWTIILLALAISACSLYWDDKKSPRITGPTAPDAYPFYPDAHVINDAGGSGCHGDAGHPDAGFWDDANVNQDDANVNPIDAGSYGYPDAALH